MISVDLTDGTDPVPSITSITSINSGITGLIPAVLDLITEKMYQRSDPVPNSKDWDSFLGKKGNKFLEMEEVCTSFVRIDFMMLYLQCKFLAF